MRKIFSWIVTFALVLGIFTMCDLDSYAKSAKPRDPAPFEGKWEIFEVHPNGIDPIKLGQTLPGGPVLEANAVTVEATAYSLNVRFGIKYGAYDAKSYSVILDPWESDEFGCYALSTDGKIVIHYDASEETLVMDKGGAFLHLRRPGSKKGEEDPEGKPEEDKDNWITPLEDMLDSAISVKSNETVHWNVGTGLPNNVMKKLYENPYLSLEFKYTYEGNEYDIFIPAGGAVNDDIEWYGPLWLSEKYGKKSGKYTVLPGDTLNDIAAKFGTTAGELMKKNAFIKDINLIYPGQEIQY